MQFIKLEIENFMRFKNAELNLANQGLVLILGENKDANNASSNGSGKTTLLDAICWCLWGRTVRGVKDDQVVNETIGKNCKVVTTLQDKGNTYKVVRYRKHKQHDKPNDLQLFINDVCDTSSDMSLTQSKINSVLGLDFKTFQCIQPGAGLRIAELTDGSIKELLESLLQSEVISKAQELTKERLSKKQEQFSQKKSELSLCETNIKYFEENLAKLQEESFKWANTKNERIGDLQHKITLKQVELDDIEDILKNENNIKKLLNEVETNLSSKLSNKDTFTKVLKVKQQETDIFVTDLVSKSAVAKALLRVDQNALDSLTKLGATCTLCNQQVDSKHVEEHSTRLKSNIKNKSNEVLVLEAAQNGALESLQTSSNELLDLLNQIESDIWLLSNQKKELQGKLQILETQKYLKEHLQNSINLLTDEFYKLVDQEAPYESLIQDTVKKAQNEASKWAVLRKESLSLKEEVDSLEFWVRGFSTKGIRNLMLKHVIPLLNQRANHYANLLTNGDMEIEFVTEKELKKGSTKDEFSINVSQKHGASSYKGNSTGERGRADLAIAFALGDLAAKRANKRISLRFLDEPFEAIDEAGHESIVKLLAEQTQYDTVFCITHKPSFQQLFSKSIIVVKEEGVSRIESQ